MMKFFSPLLITFLFASTVYGYNDYPCPLSFDYPVISNIANGYWDEQDRLFINAEALNYTNDQFNSSLYELLEQYLTEDAQVVVPLFGINATGYDEIAASYRAIRGANGGERHGQNGLIVKCTDPNNYVVTRSDISISNSKVGEPSTVMFIGKRITYISRENLFEDFKINRWELYVQARIPFAGAVDWSAEP
jgi:Fe-S cluster biosynthesis and repair protein YggX